MKRVFATAAMMLIAAACDEPITKGWLVDRVRVVAARVEAASDANRASLAPGERGRVTWLLASPRSAPRTRWSFAACAAPAGTHAEPRCDAALFGTGTGATDGETVAMEVDVPPTAAQADPPSMLVIAAFCVDGTPVLDAPSFTAHCDGGGDPLLASVRVRLASAGPNANPRAPSGVRLGDRDLHADDRTAAGEPCDAAPDALRVPAGQEIDLVHVLDAADREPGEALLLSTMTTGGELDHQYASLDPGESAPKEVRVTWKAPGNDMLGPSGAIVRFYSVLRDGRGGSAFTRFAVCVVPS